jgi:hypothetical protein
MAGRLSLVAALLIFTHPLLLRAATTDCPAGTSREASGCVYNPSPVIQRLTPELTPDAAALAAPPELLRKAQETVVPPPTAPNHPIVTESLAPSLPKPLQTLCDENRAILKNPAQSSTAAMLRGGIELRCRQVSAGQPLSRANIFRATEMVAGPESASLALAAADQAPSDPQGAVLSLEQRVLVGVTDFVVARAQQELVDYVVMDFSHKLCDPAAQLDLLGKGQPPVVVNMTQMFPRACAVLGSAGTSPDLSRIGSTFVQALKQDVHDFPPVFLNAAGSGVFCKTQDCQSAAKVALAIYQAVEAARTGGSPILAAATAAKSLDCRQAGDRDCGINFLGIVLEAFAAQYKTLQSINLQNGEDVAALVDLLATNVVIQAGQDPKFQMFVNDVDKLRKTLQALVPPVRQIVSDVNALQGSNLSKEQKIDLSQEIIESLVTVWKLGLPDDTADRAKLINIVNDVHDAWTADQAAEYDRLFAALFSLARDLDLNFPLPASVQQYLPLITALTTAQKPEDVTAALEKYAAPLGSWRDKQTGQRSVTLNAFAGGTLGATRSTGGGGQAGRLALFVPLGFDWTLNKNFGLFFSVVDLGNLAEIRFHQDNSSTEIPDVHLKEVVSPGLWLRYSFHDTPLAVGLGGSLRRQIGSTQATTDTVWQFGFFVAVDVPIFTLYKGGTPK